MTGLILSILTWLVTYTGNDVTGYIQEKYIIESYFNWVDEQEPIIYRRWRVLWQQFQKYFNWNYISWRQYTNRSDCWWIIVGYIMELWLIKSRWKDSNNRSFTYDWWWLNSYRLYRMWKPKKASQVKRWDFVYMEFSWGSRHIAVACEDWNPYSVYDLYRWTDAKCRIVKAPIMKYSSNWIVEYSTRRKIIIPLTKEILIILATFDEIPYNNYYYNIVIDYYFSLREQRQESYVELWKDIDSGILNELYRWSDNI